MNGQKHFWSLCYNKKCDIILNFVKIYILNIHKHIFMLNMHKLYKYIKLVLLDLYKCAIITV